MPLIVPNEVIEWKYEVGDWVVEPGLPNHHLRVVRHFVNLGPLDFRPVRWYGIFDTNLLERGGGDYSWRLADELEHTSFLNARPAPGQVPEILKRTEQCRHLPWSIMNRTDCESIQRWIHSGDENDRWSPQVLLGVGTAIAALVFALNRQQSR